MLLRHTLLHCILLHRIVILSALLFGSLTQMSAGAAEVIHLSSGPQQTTLLELYTSEGCSSCPPADRWLSQFTRDPRLWRQVVPVVFHVDYWNYLGWSDRFSQASYSERQRQYTLRRYSKSVYTPGFFSNGREWRSWFFNREPDFNPHSRPGALQLTIGAHNLSGRFSPLSPVSTELILNLAVLGFDLTTAVAGGENQGKQLHHDFVVLALRSYEGQIRGNKVTWQLPLPPALRQTDAGAIACWISREDDPTPIQAVGGWLTPHSNE